MKKSFLSNSKLLILKEKLISILLLMKGYLLGNKIKRQYFSIYFILIDLVEKDILVIAETVSCRVNSNVISGFYRYVLFKVNETNIWHKTCLLKEISALFILLCCLLYNVKGCT